MQYLGFALLGVTRVSAIWCVCFLGNHGRREGGRNDFA